MLRGLIFSQPISGKYTLGNCVQRSWLTQVAWSWDMSLSALLFVTWCIKYHFSMECPLFAITDVVKRFIVLRMVEQVNHSSIHLQIYHLNVQ